MSNIKINLTAKQKSGFKKQLNQFESQEKKVLLILKKIRQSKKELSALIK